MPYDPKRLQEDRTPPAPQDAPRGVCRLCHLPITGEILITDKVGIGRETWHPDCHAKMYATKPAKR